MSPPIFIGRERYFISKQCRDPLDCSAGSLPSRTFADPYNPPPIESNAPCPS